MRWFVVILPVWAVQAQSDIVVPEPALSFAYARFPAAN